MSAPVRDKAYADLESGLAQLSDALVDMMVETREAAPADRADMVRAMVQGMRLSPRWNEAIAGSMLALCMIELAGTDWQPPS